MSPDFVLMRLVSSAEYDQLEPDEDEVVLPGQEKRPPAELSPAGAVRDEAYSSENQAVPKCQWIPVLRLSKVDADADDAHHRHGHLTEGVSMEWANTDAFKPLQSGSSNPGVIQNPPLKDPVLSLTCQLNNTMGMVEDGQSSGCSCTPGEDPSDTSDALLVLQGLNTEEVEPKQPTDPTFPQNADSASFSSSPLSGLMRQVHRLTSDALDLSNVPTDPGGQGEPSQAPVPASAPRSRPPTPKHIGSPLVLSACSSNSSINEGSRERERGGRAKSRKGSLKVCLSKLFRTKSSSSRGSCGGAIAGGSHPGDTMSKRPSLASSTSSGGSLVDVFQSSEPNTPRSQLTRPHSSYSPVPFTDDLGAAQLSRLPSSMQSLQAAHPPLQHSLSLNDTTLPSVPPRRPLQPSSQSGAPVQRRSLLCPLTSSFATSLRELEKCGWYWGPMNWEDAEMKLKEKADGSFLVRDSSDPRYILSLSFRSQGVTHHTRMEHYRGTFSLWCHPKFEDRCHSVVEFIERAIMHSKNGRFLYFLRSRVPGLPPTPVQLLYPVSRFSSVKSLQHLCRFCIRQLVRIDHIQELPLPTPLVLYLRKFYFYDPEEEQNPTVKDSGRDSGAQETESQT